jgi:hypothetical protein
MMPIGLDRHVGDTIEERLAAYNDVSEAGVRALQEAGALVFLHHTEEWELETILDLPIDGIEIYNLHRNLMDGLGEVVNLLIDLGDRPEQVPDVEIGLIAFFQESEADLSRWSVASEVRRLPGILATDVHRNSLPGEAPDGERLDSYRRLMHWFSNYLLLPPGEIDDLWAMKEAIGRGRLYGAFDYLGYAEGFDFHALSAGETYEMGDEVPVGADCELELELPRVSGLDPRTPPPRLRGVILRASDGGWGEVAEGESGPVALDAEPGVYRAEVRMVPEHLRAALGERADEYLRDERVWIYSNPISVGTGF